jgi:flavin-binding protein dodecin
MAENTYPIIEVVGVSDDSIHQAVRNAITKAAQTIRNIDWFEVGSIRGAVEHDGRVVFQVAVKMGFRYE